MEKTNIYQKLLLAQGEIGAIAKTQDNPFFRSKYADINAILAVVKPILNKHGLVLTQGLSSENSHFGLNTTIVDADSKEEVKSWCPLPENLDAQKTGSAITYFRRYSLQSLLALEAQDDDGNVATEKPKAVKETKHEKEFMADIIPTDEEIANWRDKLEMAFDLKEMKAVWTSMPVMAQDKLKVLKETLKTKLSD